MNTRTLITGTSFVVEDKGTLNALIIHDEEGKLICKIPTANIALPKGTHYIVVEVDQ